MPWSFDELEFLNGRQCITRAPIFGFYDIVVQAFFYFALYAKSHTTNEAALHKNKNK